MSGVGCSLLLEHKYAITKSVWTHAWSAIRLAPCHSIVSYEDHQLLWKHLCCVAYKWSLSTKWKLLIYLWQVMHIHVSKQPLPMCYNRSNYSRFALKSDLTVPKCLINFFFSLLHIHSFLHSLELFIWCYMVWTAFPTRANVKQTLTNLPVNSSHHQNRAKKKKKKGFSLAQLG